MTVDMNVTENRKLIPFEEAMKMLTRSISGNLVTISRVGGGLTEKILRQALDLLQIRHPFLNCHIIGSPGDLHFKTEGTPKIPLRIVEIENLNTEDWQSVAIEEINNQIDSEKVLMRAVLIKTLDSNVNYLIITLEHIICDGISIVYLMSELLSICGQILSENKIPSISKLPMLPSLDDLLPKVEIKWHNQQIDKEIKTLEVEQDLPLELRKTGLVHKKLAPEITKVIISSCKEEHATVNGALCAAMMLAVADKIKDKDKNLFLSCFSAINLRQRINPPISNHDLALLASSLYTIHEIIEDKSFWELARAITKIVKEKLETDVIFESKQILESLISNYDNNMPKAPCSVGITNLGYVKIPSNYGSLKLEEISLAVAVQFSMENTFFSAALTFEESMMLNFLYCQPLISHKTIEMLAEKTISYLTRYCRI